MAVRLHHRQRGTDVSNFGQALAMADIMEKLEATVSLPSDLPP
jgi:hypothetical protein